MNFLSFFKGSSSQDQQKTIRRRLITSKVTFTGQSHLMLIFLLRKFTLPNRINSVPWMNGVTPTPYHEWTESHQLRTMNERSHINSVPWMYAIGPKNPLVNLNENDLTESANCVNSWYGVGVTALIHGTEWMWLRKVMVRSWCDRVHSWYGVLVYTVQCTVHSTVVIHLANF